MKRITLLVLLVSSSSVYAEINDYSEEYELFRKGTSILDACQESAKARTTPGFSNGVCARFVLARMNEDLASRKISPKNCREQALYDGDGEPELNMRVSLTGPKKMLVSFEGQVLDGDSEQLVILNSRTGDNAYVLFDSDTITYNDVAIGDQGMGYGEMVDSAKVMLDNGRETTVPIIQAMCLQGPKD